jgi:succinate dehydrogenase/fumarate reductase iron-sulfur protein
LKINVRIRRTGGSRGSYLQSYSLGLEGKRTVLGVLLEIQAADPSLVFRYGCRFKHCGLCGITINSRPYPACLAEVRGDLELAPLERLPVTADLAVERRFYYELFRKHEVALPPSEPPEGNFALSSLYRQLLSCTECFCCLATCPRFELQGSFPGPLFFVKVAQALLNPLKPKLKLPITRKDLEQCLDCRRCRCPYGVPITNAVQYLLSIS